MSRQPKKSLLKTLKRGLSSLFVFSVAFLPIISVVHVADVFKPNTTHDNRKVDVLPAFAHRQQDVASTIRPFQEPIITISFDDGWESVYTDAAPLLQKYGIRSTQYVLAGALSKPNYLSKNQILSLRDAGQEIACHGVNHPDLVTVDDDTLNYELNGCQTYYSSLLGTPIEDFASPYGGANDHTIAAIQHYYRSQRNTNGDITNGMSTADVNTASNFNPYNIIAFAMRDDTSLDDLQKAIDYTIANNAWLVLTYHQLEDNENGKTETFALDRQKLEAQFAMISKSPVRIASMGDVLNVLGLGQQQNEEY